MGGYTSQPLNIPADAMAIAQAPQNAMAEYARIGALKQQTAQSQAATQGQQIQNQQQQIELQDQQNAHKLGPQFLQKDDSGKITGFDNEGYYNALIGSGMNPAKVMQLRTQQLTYQQGLSKLGKDQLDLQDDKNNKAYQIAAPLHEMAMDPNADINHINQVYHDSIPRWLALGLDPKTLPASFASPQDAQAKLQDLMTELGQHKQMLADTKTQAETSQETSKANLERVQADTANWKEAGPGLLVNVKTGEKIQGNMPVEPQELAAYLKNPSLDAGKNKDAATFASWKAKQSPMAMVMGNQLPAGPGGAANPALDQAAERYSQTGVLPSGFARSPGTMTAIMSRAAELHPEANIAGNAALYGANKGALTQLQEQFSKVSAFEGTALKNLDLYVQKAQAIPDLQTRFANVPLRMITGKMIGEQNYAAMQAARNTAASEVAKVLSSATGSGVLSDTQKKEAENILDGNYPLAATLQVVQTLKQDLGNRHQSYQQEINHLAGMVGNQNQNSGTQGTSTHGDPLGIR
jgi:hypothetical protein